MSISTTTNSFLVTVSNAASAVFNTIKNVVIWSGRTVASGFNNYLVPTVHAVWSRILPALQAIGSLIKTGAVKTINFLRTGYGMGGALTAIGTGLFVHGLTQKNLGDKIAETRAGATIVVAGLAIAILARGAVVI